MSVLPVGFGSAVAGGYQISRSLRFNSADSAYLNKTFATNGTGGGITVTFSAWVKRGTLGSLQSIIGADSTAGTSTYFGFNSSNNLEFTVSATTYRVTSGVFRDPSAWYHVVLVWDSSNATDALRCRIYVNGTLQTYSTSPSITLNTVQPIGFARAQGLGADTPTSGARNYFNGYMTEVNFIDGQALTPSSFGETDSNTGVWKPKAYTGTYGINGFYLNFSDNSNTTAATLGKDYSGNGNNWTPNLFSVTAGVNNDSLVDSPTNYGTDTGVGGEVRGNYATLNPIAALTGTYSNGNLDFVTATADSTLIANVVMSSGKWYCETTKTAGSANPVVGICSPSAKNGFAPTNANQHPSVVYASSTGQKFINGTGTSYGSTYTTSDVIGIAFDADARELTFYKNGTSQGTITGVPSGDMVFCVGDGDNVNTYTGNFNFGQRAFEKWNGSAYVANTAPSGFKALCTQNLPTPTIGATSTTQANDYFNVVLYPGTGSSQSITGVGFQPDFVWIKGRSGATDHGLYDAVRGVQLQLESNTTSIETTETTGLTAFGSDGFTVGALAQLNTNTATYVAWNWNAGGSNQTISVGQYSTSPNVPSIASTVRANTTSGFSIVTYTGNGTTGATVGHGLGAVPGFIITKKRGTTTGNWQCWHRTFSGTQYITLNATNGTTTLSSVYNATPTSNVIQYGNDSDVNTNTATYVAYCFAPVAGYSAFGSYAGNNSATDGTFVYLGFRPRFLMIKSTSAGTSWVMMDSARNTYNLADTSLYGESANSEATIGTVNDIDFLSNGFKLRNNTGFVNASQTYIYAAFAESPFKYSLAR